MAGYSGTPLQKKLGLKPAQCVFIHAAPADYFSWISPLPPDVKIFEKRTKDLDFIHVFVKEKKVFEKEFNASMKNLRKDGMLWISWPKKASKVATDLDENSIRAYGLKEGMVDVKVCAVDEIWSGLKFVFRLSDR